MDSVYENALKRKKELQAELSRVDSFLEMYKNFSQLEIAEGLQALAFSTTKRERVVNGAFNILSTQQPLKSDALLQLLKRDGIDVGGADELLTLSNYLSKSGKFDSRRKQGGWFIREQQNPPQGGDST